MGEIYYEFALAHNEDYPLPALHSPPHYQRPNSNPSTAYRSSAIESEVSNLKATRTLDPHQSDRDVQSDLSYRHYMMNMVRPAYKRVFVSPPRAETIHSPAAASQSGSKWPKGSRARKKKHPNLYDTMDHANEYPRLCTRPSIPHTLLTHEFRAFETSPR
ncbi:hypothetical protein NQD34_004661 [Periophthalmus magnuspinnatus]|nr:hypothetical protein NQD34_004661 [Periophthalmus magnuspinnatus]